MIDDLANGEICLAVGYNGDILQARDRARREQDRPEIKYVIPKEGTIMWFDSWRFRRTRRIRRTRTLFINYMLRPEVIAGGHATQ